MSCLSIISISKKTQSSVCHAFRLQASQKRHKVVYVTPLDYKHCFRRRSEHQICIFKKSKQYLASFRRQTSHETKGLYICFLSFVLAWQGHQSHLKGHDLLRASSASCTGQVTHRDTVLDQAEVISQRGPALACNSSSKTWMTYQVSVLTGQWRAIHVLMCQTGVE